MSILKGLLPGLLAGMVGGIGAFTAVRVDLAVLMESQTEIKKDLEIVKDLSDRMIRQEGETKFLQYQIDNIKMSDTRTYGK